MDACREAVAAQITGEAVRVMVFVEMPHPRVGASVHNVIVIAAVGHTGSSANAADEPGEVVRRVVVVDVPGDPTVERVVDVDFVMVMAALVPVRRRGDSGCRGCGDEA